MNTSTATIDRELGEGLVSRAREFWYGMRPIWWKSCWGLRVTGLENLPKTGAMIFCANHTSHLDAAAILAALPRELALEVTTVAARDVWGQRPLRDLVAKVTTNSVALERQGDFASGFRILDRVLGEERPIILFPEGKRSFTRELLEFKSGAAMLAVRNDVPIVPVWIEGAREVMPRGQRFPQTGEIEVRFGRPIHPREFEMGAGRDAKKRAYQQITDELRTRIQKLGRAN